MKTFALTKTVKYNGFEIEYDLSPVRFRATVNYRHNDKVRQDEMVVLVAKVITGTPDVRISWTSGYDASASEALTMRAALETVDSTSTTLWHYMTLYNDSLGEEFDIDFVKSMKDDGFDSFVFEFPTTEED